MDAAKTYEIYKVYTVKQDGTLAPLDMCRDLEEYLTLKASMPEGVTLTAHRLTVDFDPFEQDHLDK